KKGGESEAVESAATAGAGAEAGASGAGDARLPERFEWTSTGPLVSPVPDRFHPILSVKDPTVVYFEERWHLFATTADTSGSWSMIYLNFEDWSEAGNAQRQQSLPLVLHRRQRAPVSRPDNHRLLSRGFRRHRDCDRRHQRDAVRGQRHVSSGGNGTVLDARRSLRASRRQVLSFVRGRLARRRVGATGCLARHPLRSAEQR